MTAAFREDRSIAITGVGLRMPGSRNLAQYFENLLSKRCFVREIPEWLWDQDSFYSQDGSRDLTSYSRLAALLDEEDDDLRFLKIPPATLRTMSRPQILGLLCAREALSDAGILGTSFDRERVGVIVAATAGCDVAEAQSETFFRKGIFDRLRSLAPNAEDLAALDRVLEEYHRAHPIYEITSESLPGRSTHLVAGRIAWAFDLHGPNITIDAACASSLAAIDCAVNSLRSGECDAVVTGGVDTWMTADAFVLFSKVTALGREGSFPFDRRADGFILGEGCGLIVLKRYLDAVAQGDKIYAVISGVGSSSDGAGVGITAPQSRGQIKAVERAYRDGCLEPDRTVYVECHGTGTGLGDPTEITSLDTFYGRTAERSLKIGSAKASVGHLRTAAGMAGLYSALLPVNAGLLPPQVNFETPSDALRRTQGRVSVQSSPDELEPGEAQVAVSGFGFGGTNFHLVLSPAHNGGREPLVEKSRFSQPLLPVLKNDVAFLFPGQGSQYVGMLEELRGDPTLAEYFLAADRVVEEVAGLNLLKALYPESDGTDAAAGIRNTVLAQPAILTVSAALFRLVSNQGILPSLMVGHSLGEYTALYAAGAVGFEAAIRAVTLRGRIMSENPSGEESSLLCLLGPRHKALAVCERFAPRLEAANFNSYEQLVVAGPSDILRQAADFAEEIGLSASPLKVDRGFHSSFVKHTIAPMREHLETLDWVLPKVPIPANSARQFYPFERDQEKELRGKEKGRLITLLSTQISAPVDFVSQIELAYEAGIRRFVEVGPRSVLSGLVDEILQGKKFQCVSLDRSNRSLYERVAELPTTLQAPLTFQRRPPARCRARNIHGTERLATSQAQSPEERVRAVVAGVSGYPPDQLPLDAEFEELGLDSLKLVEIVARLRGSVLPTEHRGFRGLTSIRKILSAGNGIAVHRAPGKTRCFQVVSSLVPDLKCDSIIPSDWRCSLWEHPASGLSFTDSAANLVVLATLPSRLDLHQRFLPFLLTSIQTQARDFPGSRFALATVAGCATGRGGEKALTAFLRSAARDVPSLRFSYHHFESSDCELENALSDERVGITVTSSGERLHETLLPAGLTHEAALSDFLDESDLILVSGGARGIASIVVRKLLKSTRSRFLLIGRSTGGPSWLSPEFADRVEYLSCDISDSRAVRAAKLDTLPITVFIHAAGTGSICPFMQRQVQDMQEIFAAKVSGLDHIAQNLDQSGLRAIILFSSISAFFGMHGQADYAAANALLDGFTCKAPVLSLQWTAWDDEGMAVRGDTRSLLSTTGLEFLPGAEGAELFEQLVGRWMSEGSQSAILSLIKGVPETYRSLLPRETGDAEMVERPIQPSAAQCGIYYLERAYPLGDCHNVSWSEKMVGPLDAHKLAMAFQELVDRNEVLRSKFEMVEGEIVGSVLTPLPADFELLWLKAGETVDELITRLRREAFDLSRPPLIRGRLIQLDQEDHVLLVVVHHIAVDGVSTHLLRQQLAQAYAGDSLARTDGDDFYGAIGRRRSRGCSQTNRTFWTELLRSRYNDTLFGQQRPDDLSFACGHIFFQLAGSLWEGALQQTRQLKVTPFTLLAAAFAVFLREMSGRQKVVFGVPLEGRPQIAERDVVGLFVNTMPMVVDLSSGTTLERILKEVKDGIYSALEHQDFDFEELLQTLSPIRRQGLNPIFQAVVEYQQMETDGVDLGGLGGLDRHFVSHPPDHQFYDIVFSILNCGDKCFCRLSFRFDKIPFKRGGELRDRLVEAVEYLSGRPAPPDHGELKPTLPQALAKAASTNLEGVALSENASRTTYQELLRRVDRRAADFHQQGVKKEQRVLVQLARSAETVEVFLALLKCGAVVVPCEVSDPIHRLREMATEVEASYIVGDNALAGVRTLTLDHLDGLGGTCPDFHQEVAFILFTSGSTGTPKGVMISHANILSLVANMRCLRLSSDDRVLHCSSLSFDAWFFEVWVTLLYGATVVIHYENRVTLPGLERVVTREAVTRAWFTSTLFNLIVDENPAVLAPLKQVLTGGEVVSPIHMERAMREFPRLEICNLYGPTECTTFTTLHSVSLEDLVGGAAVPIGWPLATFSTVVVDGDSNVLPAGQVGELLVAGGAVCLGYLDPEMDEGAFWFSDSGKRYYRTGDLVRQEEDGSFHFVGRADRQIKIRGFRVEPAEVERRLLDLDSVRRCAVSGVHNGLTRELVAYVVPLDSKTESLEIAKSLSQLIPSYLVPSRIAMVKELPRKPSGKIDWSEFEGSAPILSPSGYSIVLPREPLEELIAMIWEDALKIKPVSVRDDFTSLGGHSLIALQIFARIEKLLNKKLPLSTLFHAPTVERLAAVIREQGWQTSWDTVVPMKTGETGPTIYCVHPADGNVFCYRHLARSLSAGVNFYALQACGLDGGAQPHETVEEMAEFYLDALLKHQPDGPFLLGGFSSGGAVAYQLAYRLRQMGRKVSFLALMDTFFPLGSYSAQERARGDLAQTLSDIKRVGGDAVRYSKRVLTSGERIDLDTMKKVAHQASRVLLGRLGLAPRHFYDTDGHRCEFSKPTLVQLSLKSLELYDAPRYDGPVVLFRSKDNQLEGTHDGRLEWQRVLERELQVVSVPGNHFTLLEPPHCQSLANQLENALLGSAELV